MYRGKNEAPPVIPPTLSELEATPSGAPTIPSHGIFEVGYHRPLQPPSPTPFVIPVHHGAAPEIVIQNTPIPTDFKAPDEIGGKLADALRIHDESKITNCNSDIDTLLVFAGLFSAILAAFLIESYRLLQRDPTDVSVQLLMQISVQIAALAGNSSAIVQLPEIPQFIVPSSAIRVNALWFAGLLCSLVTASLAMFVKQWLREYLALGCTSTEERIRVRHVRYEGLVRWKVFETAAVLPLLLQIALLLFLIGLSEFLRAINRTVWLSTTVLVVIWLSIYAASIFAPALSIICPYKTPLLDRVMQQLRGLLSRIRYGTSWRERTGCNNRYYRFPGDERGIRRDNGFDIPAIISADETLADDSALVHIIRDCIERANGPETVAITREILSHRLDTPIASLSDPISFDRIPTRVLEVIVSILSNAIRRDVMSPNVQWTQWLQDAITGLASLMNHVHSNGRAVSITEGVDAISGTFALPLPIVSRVLRILAIDSPFISSWTLSGPPGTSFAAMTVISATREMLRTVLPSDPLRLLGEVLAIMNGMPDPSLHTCAKELESLTHQFATIMSASRRKYIVSPERGSLATYTNHLLLISESINARSPGSIDQGLMAFLSRQRGRQQLAPQGKSTLPLPEPSGGHVFGTPGVRLPMPDRRRGVLSEGGGRLPAVRREEVHSIS